MKITVHEYLFDEKLYGDIDTIIEYLTLQKSKSDNARLMWSGQGGDFCPVLIYDREETDEEKSNRIKKEKEIKAQKAQLKEIEKQKLIKEAKKLGLKVIE